MSGSSRSERSSMKMHIAKTLRDEIAAGKWLPGKSLPSLKALAERFGTSIGPVQHAFGVLEEEGLVVCKVGSGTFVTDRRPVSDPNRTAVLFPGRQHLLAEILDTIMGVLHANNVYPCLIDTSKPQTEDMLRHAIREARIIIIDGNATFPYHLLDETGLAGKRIIGVPVWEKQAGADAVARITIDLAAGGALAAEHLLQRGHRRVAILGTTSMLADSTGIRAGFDRAWRNAGGEALALASIHAGQADEPLVDDEAFLSRMRGEQAPTALFGLRDVEAYQAASILARHEPALLERIDLIGYGNTPWSRTPYLPFSSIDWNMDTLLHAVEAKLLSALETPDAFIRDCQIISPRLIVRERYPTLV